MVTKYVKAQEKLMSSVNPNLTVDERSCAFTGLTVCPLTWNDHGLKSTCRVSVSISVPVGGSCGLFPGIDVDVRASVVALSMLICALLNALAL